MSKSLNTEMTSVPKSDSEVWLSQVLQDYNMDLSPTLVKSYNQVITSYKVYTYSDWII